MPKRLVDMDELFPSEEVEGSGFADFLHEWVDKSIPVIEVKARAYGSHSLAEMGRLYARNPELDEKLALQVGAFVYAFGKMGRVVDAIRHNNMPSTDTVHDLAVYALMALYIEQKGEWP